MLGLSSRTPQDKNDIKFSCIVFCVFHAGGFRYERRLHHHGRLWQVGMYRWSLGQVWKQQSLVWKWTELSAEVTEPDVGVKTGL